MLFGKKLLFTRNLCNSVVVGFKEAIPSALNSVSCLILTEDSYANFNPSQIDHLVENAAGSLQTKQIKGELHGLTPKPTH